MQLNPASAARPSFLFGMGSCSIKLFCSPGALLTATPLLPYWLWRRVHLSPSLLFNIFPAWWTAWLWSSVMSSGTLQLQGTGIESALGWEYLRGSVHSVPSESSWVTSQVWLLFLITTSWNLTSQLIVMSIEMLSQRLGIGCGDWITLCLGRRWLKACRAAVTRGVQWGSFAACLVLPGVLGAAMVSV